MRIYKCSMLAAVAVIAISAGTAFSQAVSTGPAKGRGKIVVPSSSVEQPGDVGAYAHTHLQMMVPADPLGPPSAAATPGLPPYSGYLYETPASISCIYHLVSGSPAGCNPNSTTISVTGGSGTIAIVDAYDDPNAAADLAYFSKQFGLPAASFQVLYAGGTQPAMDPTGGWELEESLDIEWAHAMAPNAKIFLVEAASNSFTDLFSAVVLASGVVAGYGGGEVSMSWGGSEFSSERAFDVYFQMPGVVYTASTGDSPGVIYPAVSPFVVAAGGTTLSRDIHTGSLVLENAWQEAGGGTSRYEPRPFYQDDLAGTIGTSRGTPDLSFDSNPTTGVWVYDTSPMAGSSPGWYIVGGTSVAAPSLAGIINNAGSFAASSVAENVLIYGNTGGNSFKDITYGNCGIYATFFAVNGWDFCSGMGSVNGLMGK